MQGAFVSVVLDTEWPGCPAIWVRTSCNQENLMQENFGLIFVPLNFKGPKKYPNPSYEAKLKQKTETTFSRN